MGARDLPLAARLLAQAEALERASTRMRCFEAPCRQRAKGRLCPPTSLARALASAAGGEQIAVPLGDTIERLEQAVLEELATVEAMRERLKGLPQRPRDAEPTARTLSIAHRNLAETAAAALRAATGSNDDDDMPADIDEFRHELARRIERSSQAGLIEAMLAEMPLRPWLRFD